MRPSWANATFRQRECKRAASAHAPTAHANPSHNALLRRICAIKRLELLERVNLHNVVGVSYLTGHLAYSITPGWESFDATFKAAQKVADYPHLAGDEAREAVHSLSLPHKPFAPTLTWRGRLGLAPVAALALACCVLFVAPLEVILPGSSSLSFTLANVWLPLLGLIALVGALIALAASATRGHAFDVILALIAALCVSTLLQEVVLNGNLPVADGTPVDWTIYDKVNLKSALAWFAVVAAFIALARLRPLASRVASVAACLLIVIAQSVGLGMLGAQYADTLARPVVPRKASPPSRQEQRHRVHPRHVRHKALFISPKRGLKNSTRAKSLSAAIRTKPSNCSITTPTPP